MTQAANLAALGSNASSTGTLGASSFASATIPNSALSGNPTFRNRIINGSMIIDQRGPGTYTPASTYTLDRWQGLASVQGKYTIQQSTTAPAGFNNSVLVTSSAATTPGAAEQYAFSQAIEANNVADFNWGTANAKTITVSFWVRSSLTGTFSFCLNQYSGARSYATTYTISAANTWEYKTITISGDQSGTWTINNSGFFYAMFDLGSGSNFLTGSSSTWLASNLRGVTGSIQLIGTNGATMYITGVQLEVGSAASPFENRLYGTELQLCQRYYETFSTEVYNTSGVPNPAPNADKYWYWLMKVPKRTTPTFTYTGGANLTSLTGDVNTGKYYGANASYIRIDNGQASAEL